MRLIGLRVLQLMSEVQVLARNAKPCSLPANAFVQLRRVGHLISRVTKTGHRASSPDRSCHEPNARPLMSLVIFRRPWGCAGDHSWNIRPH